MNEGSCEDRIEGSWSRVFHQLYLANLSKQGHEVYPVVVRSEDGYEVSCGEKIKEGETYEAFLESILSIETSDERPQSGDGCVVRVLLSYGGPEDGFYVHLDGIGQDATRIKFVSYYLKDWFDSAERYLRRDELDLFCDVLEDVILDWAYNHDEELRESVLEAISQEDSIEDDELDDDDYDVLEEE